jgi:alpha-L-fucosidase 2
MVGQVKGGAIRFEARLVMHTEGGKVEARDSQLVVTGASAATLVLSGATNFVNYKDVSADPKQRNDAVLAAIKGKSYDALKSAHIADHQRLFRRVSLDIGTSPAASQPTDARIAAFVSGSDPGRAAVPVRPLPADRLDLPAGGRHQGIWNHLNNRAGTASTR